MGRVGQFRETELYGPLKAYLEGQGYEVKGEIGAADLVAVRGDEPPVIVELKTGFSLALFHQGIARQAMTDAVYLAVPKPGGTGARRNLRENIGLARRLGLGVITVRLPEGTVEVHADPGPYSPRKSKARTLRLLREFERRVGDPSEGGTSRRVAIVTAYRQDALRCVAHLASGEAKGAAVAAATGVARATRLMADDHYGWFERVRPGWYRLTPKGDAARTDYAYEIAALTE
ncbi:MAG: DUF2161 family putative PD-(D/E)XK-type phosphodiesterase [Pseudomonadota bacterium]